METLKTVQDICRKARELGPVKTAVAEPYDPVTIETVVTAFDQGIISPVLYGDQKIIRPLLNNHEDIQIVDCPSEGVQQAVKAVRECTCGLLMKGSVSTPKLLSACLNKAAGINSGKFICNVVVSSIPGRNRLLAISDAGLNILPTLEQKVEITKAVAALLGCLGVQEPKIALLSSAEEVTIKNISTVDAAIITQMNRRRQIEGAIVDGPLAMDNIISLDAAKKKKIDSKVAGDADAIIVPNVECGNAIVKMLAYFAKSTNCSVVLGAMAPIALPSRSGKMEAKLGAVALGTLMAIQKGGN